MTKDLIVAGNYLEVVNYRKANDLGLDAHSVSSPIQLEDVSGPKRAKGSQVKIHWVGTFKSLRNYPALELQARIQGFETPGL